VEALPVELRTAVTPMNVTASPRRWVTGHPQRGEAGRRLCHWSRPLPRWLATTMTVSHRDTDGFVVADGVHLLPV
jgi:hypothetical protein